MSRRLRIYLAGPEVFLPQAEQVFDEKRTICERYGLQGVSPLDSHVEAAGTSPRETAQRISAANESLMRSCDLVIANLTPFRSPSADPGTAMELGFFRAQGKPVLGYSNVKGTLVQRTRHAACPPHGTAQPTDDDGLLIEDFGLAENLMLEGAIVASGFELVQEDVSMKDRYVDLSGFETCVRMASRKLQVERGSTPGVRSVAATISR